MERLAGTGTILAGGFYGLYSSSGEISQTHLALTSIYVSGLAHPDFLVELDAIAVVPL